MLGMRILSLHLEYVQPNTKAYPTANKSNLICLLREMVELIFLGTLSHSSSILMLSFLHIFVKLLELQLQIFLLE